MIYPLIDARTHGFFDDAMVLLYLMGSYFMGVSGHPLGIVIIGGVFHLALTRVTRYPAGMLRLVPFRAHGYVELVEGVVVLVLALATVPGDAPGHARAFIASIGILLIGSFAITDYRTAVKP